MSDTGGAGAARPAREGADGEAETLPRLPRSAPSASLRHVNFTRATLSGLLAVTIAACNSGAGAVPEHLRPRVDFGYPTDTTLRMNDVQVKATHNSYHVETEGNGVAEWHYTHAPFDVQLDTQGVRSFELDLHRNFEDGTFEVFHIPRLDEGSRCRKFKDCLTALKTWSDANPGHAPLYVMIEPKEEPPTDAEEYFDAMEQEVLAVWPRDWIVAPADVQRDAPTLRAAVTGRGWPLLGEVRGTVLFFLNDAANFRDRYTRGGHSVTNRLMFPQAIDENDPLAAIFVLNDPVGDGPAITSAVAHGFIVRTITDGYDGIDPAIVSAALATGVHILSTDHPVPTDAAQVGDVSLTIPGGTPSRCNPVRDIAGCTSTAIEDPGRLRAPR